MNIHNDLYFQYINAKIGTVSILKAYEKGYIDAESFNVIMALAPDYTLDQIIGYKSDEFSYICDKTIANGVDVVLEDGTTEHFSLSDKDQININSAYTDIVAGATDVEYHADNSPFKLYSAKDMLKICITAKSKVKLETAYRNNLREWIKQLTDVEDIRKITYGMEIPEEYWTEGWRSIQKKIEHQKANERNGQQTEEFSDDSQAQSADIMAEEAQPEENILTKFAKAVSIVTAKDSKKKKANAKEESNE